MDDPHLTNHHNIENILNIPIFYSVHIICYFFGCHPVNVTLWDPILPELTFFHPVHVFLGFNCPGIFL